MTKAYSYLRFSTPEQMRGDSFRRQADLARHYALQKGLELDQGLTFHDLGVSAFRGKNAETGRLGEFLEAVKAGLVSLGSYLLVESLDRISRQSARKALNVLNNIVDEGITVVTLSDGRAYDAASLDDDPMSLMYALLIFIRSNEESATKGRRLKAAWAAKRSKANEKVMTARGPAWLFLQTDGIWSVLEDRAKVVRRVFCMAAEGMGHHAICAALNQEGVETFGSGSHWHRSYVGRILSNPAVIGTFVPHVLTHDAGKRRTPQTPIERYFPAIVDEDTFERVRAMSLSSRSPLRGRHSKRPIQNLLGGLAKCPLCGGSMTRVSKGASQKAGPPYLVCTRAKAGAGCRYRAVRLEYVERALRENAPVITSEVPSPQEDGSDLQDRLLSLQTGLEVSEERLHNLLDALAADPSPAIRAQVREREDAIEELKRDERELLELIAASHGPLLEGRVANLEAKLEQDPFDIGEANVALRQVLSSVIVDFRDGQLELEWLHGGTSYILFAWPEEENRELPRAKGRAA
jgi:DNA invertase Pin-like site-specific DNA recombinase